MFDRTAELFLAAVLGASIGAGAMAWAWRSEETPLVPPPEPVVVRMLDVTIRDSNTTNRRQCFECLPVKERK